MGVYYHDPVSGSLLLVAGSATTTLVADVETTSTSSRNYAVGDQFVLNGQLYTATTPIAVGDTLTPGTNCSESDNVTKQIKAVDNKVGLLTSLATTVKTSIVAAINEIKAQADKCECLVLTQASISALPVTISNAAIETDMVVINAVLSNPAAQTADWTVNTDTAGQATISGTISGTTDLTLYLMKSR